MMLPELRSRIDQLEERRRSLMALLKSIKEEQIIRQPGPDRWSLLQVLQHIVLGEIGMRLSENELRENPVREHLRPGNLIGVVRDILDRDVPVEVPDARLEPDGKTSLSELFEQWEAERRLMADLLETVTPETREVVMFSHPAAGPMPPLETLDLALSHFDHHRRQIERLMKEVANHR